MFTGLIQQLGKMRGVKTSGGSGTLALECGPWDKDLVKGESICVSGTCLTLTGWDGGLLTFDVLRETLDRTCLGGKKRGELLNLERSLRVGDAMGGHFVTGHVDGTGEVTSLRRVSRDWAVTIGCDKRMMAGMVPKGSVACDGISLTLTALDDDGFSVQLIPHTWEQTSFQALKVGSKVNIETDLLGKHVRRVLEGGEAGRGVSMETLRKSGFAG